MVDVYLMIVENDETGNDNLSLTEHDKKYIHKNNE